MEQLTQTKFTDPSLGATFKNVSCQDNLGSSGITNIKQATGNFGGMYISSDDGKTYNELPRAVTSQRDVLVNSWDSTTKTAQIAVWLPPAPTNILVAASQEGTAAAVLANQKAIADANIYKIEYNSATGLATLTCETIPTVTLKLAITGGF